MNHEHEAIRALNAAIETDEACPAIGKVHDAIKQMNNDTRR